MANIFFYEPFYDFDRLVHQVFNTHNNLAHTPTATNNRQLERRSSADGAIRSFKPRMDLHENSEKNLVTATFELPGVKKDHVQIDMQNGLLTVAAEVTSSVEHEEQGYAVRERRFGKFARTLRLPEGTKDEDVKAEMQDGVLTITFPKSSPQQAPKKISVN